MEKLRTLFMTMFEGRIDDAGPDADDVVFGSHSRYALESMDTLRFVSALLPVFGDRVYDLKIEEITTLGNIDRQLQPADR